MQLLDPVELELLAVLDMQVEQRDEELEPLEQKEEFSARPTLAGWTPGVPRPWPGVLRPGVPRPGVSGPGMPGVSRPGVSTPGVLE